MASVAPNGYSTTDPSSPYFGMPGAPNYVQGYDPATMNLSDYLTGKYDNGALAAYKDQAMRKGPSSWAELARSQNLANEANSRETGAREVHGQTEQAMDELASRGGLSSGARERAATEGSKNYLSMSQDLARQGNLNDMQIGMNDEQNRVQQLSALPGMEMSQAQMFEGAKQQDIGNTVAENDRRNQYNQNLYGQQMNAWSANQQANATARSGKK